MASFARIAVNVPSMAGVFAEGGNDDRSRPQMTFDYEVPRELGAAVSLGTLVIVPFGNRTVQGVVLELIDQPAVAQTKVIMGLADPDPVLTSAQIALAQWMATNTLTPIGAIVRLFLPPGLAQQADTVYEIRTRAPDAEDNDVADAGTTKLEARLLALLTNRGPLRGRQLDRALPRMDWRLTARYLIRRGVLSSYSVLPPASVRPKLVRTAQLAADPAFASEAMANLGSTEATRARRAKALEYLIDHPEAIDVAWVYAESGCKAVDLQELAERDLIVLREREVWRDPLRNRVPESGKKGEFGKARLSPLTEDQQRAWDAILAGWHHLAEGEATQSFLLRGVTGSGKTELYLRAALEASGRGHQSIVLVPEISLTPQTVGRFMTHFPGRVGLIHSKLSDGERYDTWRRARGGALQVVIGPRSALFAPLPRIGLLVLDECHDASYHQSEPPFYDAATAAQAYVRMCNGICIMGSATPSVVQRYQSDIGHATRLELRQRVAAESETAPAPKLDLPQVQVVDMRAELKAGNRSSFSRELRRALEEVLEREQQAILFLNRRGTATHVFCRSCGHVVRCPRCETPLTFHVAERERLLCHRCGYERRMPHTCSECGSPDIRAYGMGTEKLEREIQKAFPKARTLRWDRETTRQKDAHEIILHHFAAGRADILIGTQMLAKGLDLPRVTLVGIVMADVGLFLPDPFAAERVFQVLTQVAGRAGRSTRGGRVILQTFAPEQYAIQAAARHDVEGFQAHELTQRRRLGYPPFTRLLRLEYRHHDALKAEEEALLAAAGLRRKLANSAGTQAAMIGPAPAFFSKVDGKYRWQIVLRGADPTVYLEGERLSDWRIEVDPVSLL